MIFDGIILGTGHNALVLQAYLSRCGLRTLSVDRAPIPGGGLMTIDNPRLPGFRHNPHSFFHRAITAMPWFRDLELERHGVRYVEPKLNVAMILRDGRALEWWTDLDRTIASFAEFSRRDADSLRRLAEEFEPIVEKILRAGSPITAVGPGLRRRLLERFRIRPAPPGDLRVVAARICHAALRERRRARRPALLQWPARSGPPLDGFRPLHSRSARLARRRRRWRSAERPALAAGLVADITEHGGEVRCGVELRRILVRKVAPAALS